MSFYGKNTQVIEMDGGGGADDSYTVLNKMKIIDSFDVTTTPTQTQIDDGFTVSTTLSSAQYGALPEVAGHYSNSFFNINRIAFAMVFYTDKVLTNTTDAISFAQTNLNIRGGFTSPGMFDNASEPMITQCTILNNSKTTADFNTFQKIVDFNTSDVDKYSDRVAGDFGDYTSRLSDLSVKSSSVSDGIDFTAKSIFFLNSDTIQQEPLAFSGFGYVLYFGMRLTAYLGSISPPANGITFNLHVNQNNKPNRQKCGFYSGVRFTE